MAAIYFYPLPDSRTQERRNKGQKKLALDSDLWNGPHFLWRHTMISMFTLAEYRPERKTGANPNETRSLTGDCTGPALLRFIRAAQHHCHNRWDYTLGFPTKVQSSLLAVRVRFPARPAISCNRNFAESDIRCVSSRKNVDISIEKVSLGYMAVINPVSGEIRPDFLNISMPLQDLSTTSPRCYYLVGLSVL